jgi:hypothetical protein
MNKIYFNQYTKKMQPYDCDYNNVVCNLHTVPIVDVLTASTLFTAGLAIFAGVQYNYSLSAVILLIIILLSINILIHPYFGMPNNLSYYFGLGKKPSTWRTCQS